nr:hypothetical protein [uncultured Anaeromusa sp.]
MFSKMGEAIKTFCSANKKKIRNGVLLAVFLGMLFVGAQAMFQVKGVVTAVDGSQITVSNFFRAQTIDLAGAPVLAADIKVGDRIKIQKNLQGDILYAKFSQLKNSDHDKEQEHHHKETEQRMRL